MENTAFMPLFTALALGFGVSDLRLLADLELKGFLFRTTGFRMCV